MTDTVEYIKRLQAVVDKLHAEGADPVFVVTALIDVTVAAAKLDRSRTRAAVYLDDASDALAVAAHKLREP